MAIGVDDEAGAGIELLAGAPILAVDLVDCGQQHRPALGEELVQHLVLGLEVVVDEPVRNPGLVGDVRHPAGMEAGACEHPAGGVEDLAALVDRGGAGHQEAAICSSGQA